MLEKFSLDVKVTTDKKRLNISGSFPNEKCLAPQTGARSSIRQIAALLTSVELQAAIDDLRAMVVQSQ